MKKYLRYLLLIVAFFVLGMFARLVYQRYEPKEKYIQTISSPNLSVSAKVKQERFVWVISIPKINRKLRIDPITVDKAKDAKEWPISSIGVNLVNSKAVLGASGNSVIYGHNWKSIFGDLKKLQRNDQIVIYNGSSEKLIYRVTKISVVDIKQAELLEDHGLNELTIYTCTGILDSKRLVVTSSFVANLGAAI